MKNGYKLSRVLQQGLAVGAALAISASQLGCLQGAPTAIGTAGATATGGSSSSSSSSGSSGSGSTSTSVSTFINAGSSKIVFNKNSFFNNFKPNTAGCAGDAKDYYDPQTDRVVPVRPKWLKNVSVELTNSNAQSGPSLAVACGLSGIGSPEAKNCAAFDDLQPLQGDQARAVLVGGSGCLTNSTNCTKNNIIGDVWALAAPDSSTNALWVQQSGALPKMSAPATAIGGLVWHGGDYDEIHDQFYTFGGATPSTSSASSTAVFNDKIGILTFSSDRTLSTTIPPAVVTPSTRANYAGWSTVGTNIVTQMNVKNINVPPALVGPTFTYGLRRDPSMKSYCQEGSAGCTSSKLVSTSSTNAISLNEHEDYFLLVGGMPTATTAQGDFTSGIFSKQIYVYKPHGFSNDVGTNGATAPAGGDWELVSNIRDTGAGLLANVGTKVMAVADIAFDSSSTTEPYVPSFVGDTRPQGDVFTGWAGRAYHRTVYDPTMNRFYIFGGLENTGGASALAGGTAPTLADSDVWVYDPPSLSRRPTAACFTTQTPDAKTLPIGSTGSTDGKVLGTNLNLGPNRAYAAAPFVFPPGGCLQRIDTSDISSSPDARFEHAMAFDRDQKAMMVFGGCISPSTITDSGNAPTSNLNGPGSPLINCSSSTALLNDAWLWIAPVRTEFVSQDYRAPTGVTSPYNSSTLLANIFSMDFWLRFLNTFIGDNSASNTALTAPSIDQVLGKWIHLTSSGTTPTKRVSASLIYDRSHHKFYLQGGFGCTDAACSTIQVLNDLWEFTPPNIDTECDKSAGTCTNQGTWIAIRANKDDDTGQPTQRMGATAAFAEPQFSHGDDFYTVTDSACVNQGPIATNDASVNRQFVGAIYVDIDRNQMGTTENLLINLRFLPFDSNTRGPAYFDNNTVLTSVDDSDASSTNDESVIRVQLLSNPFKNADQIQTLIQPRFHEFISGAPILADTFMYVSGASGQITEKQIHVPLTLDPNINLIKIERVQGSVKFYEMTVSKF